MQGPTSRMEKFEAPADAKGLKNWCSEIKLKSLKQVVRLYHLPCMMQLSLPGPAQSRQPLPRAPTGSGSRVPRAAAGSQSWSLGAFGWASMVGQDGLPPPSCQGTPAATDAFLRLLLPHLLSDYAISQFLCFGTEEERGQEEWRWIRQGILSFAWDKPFCGFEGCKMTLPIQGMNQPLLKRAQRELSLPGKLFHT